MNRLEPLARRWQGSLQHQGWHLWLAQLRACVPAWLMPAAPPEQVYHWPLSGPVAPSTARQVLMLPREAVLLQTVRLPLAAARNPAAVIGYELDRYTPFAAEQLYVVVHQPRRTATGLEVTVVAVLRERLDPILSECAQLGVQPCRVDVASLGIDLLPAGLRPRQSHGTRVLRRALAGLCGVLLVGVMGLWLSDRQAVLAQMRATVLTQKTQVARLQQVRQQLANTRDAADYLTRRKAAQPPLAALLNELTGCLPADTWVEQLEVTHGADLTFTGQSAKASALIARIKTCHRLEDVRFEGVIQPDAHTGKEHFSLRAHLHQEAVDAPNAD